MFWNVYLHGRRIACVWYVKECNKEYVLDSLIKHDKYHPDIKIFRRIR